MYVYVYIYIYIKANKQLTTFFFKMSFLVVYVFIISWECIVLFSHDVNVTHT